VDAQTGKRCSLKTKNRDAALQIVLTKNQALRQPVLNVLLAKAYLAGTGSGVASRTWQNALDALVETRQDSKRVLRCANVDRQVVSVEYQHDRLVQ